MRHQATPQERLESRVQGDFLESPELRLSIEQAQRFWSLDLHTCSRVLETLVARGFLMKDAAGNYARPAERWPAPLQMAKADLSRSKRLKQN
jgi:Fic family protein